MDSIIIKYYLKANNIALGTERAYAQISARRATRKRSLESGKEYECLVTQLTRQEAVDLIKEKKLTIAVKNKDGIIWDTPNQSFMDKYRGNIVLPESELF